MDQHIPDSIKELVEKALKGTISKEESELLDLWYHNALPEEVLWKGPDKSKVELKQRLFNQISQLISENSKTSQIPFYRSGWFRVAATVVLVSSFAFYFLSGIFQSEENRITSGNKEIKKIILPDSSIVWLKGDSRITFPDAFDDSIRYVRLEGEALFEVSKDKQHPFIIRTENYSTRVLGTSFNLDTRNKHYKLTVLTGKVQVNEINPVTQSQKVLAVVLPNQTFNRMPQQASAIRVSETSEKLIVTRGTEYPMAFEHTPFMVIINRLEEKFDVKFSNSDWGAYSSCNLTADLTDQSLKNSLEILSAAIGAEYTIEGKNIEIKGGGCK